MTGKMEDGITNSDSSSNLQPSFSMDSLFDNLLTTSHTCTHTHTCNPPGPDTAHTHTCYHTHTHTQVIPPPIDHAPPQTQGPAAKAGRPLGNREAVRKYREKKKAHAAYLEEEVTKLRLVNQQLMKKMQRQSILEAELLRLKGLLVDIRGKLNVELGAFPFQKKCNTVCNFEERNCGVKSTSLNDLSRLSGSSVRPFSIDGCGEMMANLESNCQPAIVVDCQANTNGVGCEEERLQDSMEMLVQSAPQAE